MVKLRMQTRLSLLIFLLMPALALGSGEVRWQERPEIARLFAEAGVNGTFASCRTADGVVTGHNAERATRRFIPASTFKVPNTLIVLEAGVMDGIGEVFAWDGEPKWVSAWERDMGLREALRVSNLHVYQELARRVGHKAMADRVESLGYGNAHIGEAVDRFWLEGPLEISAVEQCRFMLRVAARELGFPDTAHDFLEETLAEPAGEGITVFAKTGWGNATDPDIGWWVGWVEGPFGIAGFALNMDIHESADASKRVSLGRRALGQLGYLPQESVR